MVGKISFCQCPNCYSRGSVWGRLDIYKCPICFKIFCERCVTRGWFAAYCPGCGAKLRSRQQPIGYA